jgi:hypothetical protein
MVVKHIFDKFGLEKVSVRNSEVFERAKPDDFEEKVKKRNENRKKKELEVK